MLARYAPEVGLASELTPFWAGGSSGCRDVVGDGGGDGAAWADALRLRFAESPFLMAPMAGVSDAAWRQMARAGGAALAYTEMVSVAGLHYGGEKTWDLVVPHDPEPDVAVQLFGADPALFEDAARAVLERLGGRLALLDVNMACPVPKVTRKGEGSALLDDPERAARIVRACRRGVEDAVPVTVKVRRGRRTGEEQAPEFSRAMEEAGAAAVAVHGRFADQLYRGEASWEAVGRVVRAVGVPVIGSGDVGGAAEACELRARTGCAAVMVARGSYGNPWVFGQAHDLLGGGKMAEKPDDVRRVRALSLHVRLLAANRAHLARARSLVGWYLKGMPHATTWRNRAMTCVTLDDYLALLDEALEQLGGEARG